MKRHLHYFSCLLIILLGIYTSTIQAQQNNVWAFGHGAGVNFNGVNPVAIKTNIHTREGCASISDDNGQLLFYTDGDSVWNRNNMVIQNGTDLAGVGVNITASTTQGALVVPMPGHTGKYYIFSLGAIESRYDGKLYYSVVDVNLNSGMSGVISKGILLDSNLTEQMTAVSGPDCNIWLLVVSRDNNCDVKAYNIDVNGIDPTPVISPGVKVTGIIGSMDVSPDGTKLVLGQGNLILYDFDIGSGSAVHPAVLNPDNNYYSVCFSPDNSKLYASNLHALHQFDLSSDTLATIINSKTFIAYDCAALQRAPDGKIYAVSNGLSVIKQPNLAGTACEWVSGGLPLIAGTTCSLGLPNVATFITHRKVHRSKRDTIPCVGSLRLEAGNQSGINYIWGDGPKGSSRFVNTPGIYWVSYQVNSPCMLDDCVDTFIVTAFPRQNVSTINTYNAQCKSDIFLLEANDPFGSGYVWENGSTGSRRSVSHSGVYWVRYQVDSACEDHVDSFIVRYPTQYPRASFVVDTLVCLNDVVRFRNTSDAQFSNFSWLFGDFDSSEAKDPEYTFQKAGKFEIRLIGWGNSCPDTVYKTITVDAPLNNLFFSKSSALICTGMKVAFTPSQTDRTTLDLSWDFGDGTQTISYNNEAVLQHAYDRSGMMPIALTAHFRACPDRSFRDTVVVASVPRVDLGADTALCYQGMPVILSNHVLNATGTFHYLWNTGDTTLILNVMHPGIYRLKVTSQQGCSATSEVAVKKGCYLDIPNAFTPNGDGHNDYFFPRQLLSQKLTQFSLKIFNRWGQLVFETEQTDGRGWDGYLNGRKQPEGVYVYIIEAEIDKVRREHYQGNITLLR